MNRRRGFLLSLLMVLCIFGLSAFPEYAPYGEDVAYYYGYLTREEQELYDIIYDGVLDYRSEIEFPHGYPMDMVDRIVSMMMDESPELFWLDHSWSSSYYESDPDVAIGVEIDYIMSEREAIGRWKKIMKFHESIEYDGTSDLIDELIMIEALSDRTTYTEGRYVYDASAAIVDGRAVCEGYSKAAALLLRLHGIPAGVIGGIGISDGEEEPHAWNIVKIGGEWTLLDLTWIDDDDASFYDWINLSDEMFEDTHIPENVPSSYHVSSSNYELSRLLELYSEGNVKRYFFTQLEQLIEEDIPVLIYFEDEGDYQRILDLYEDWLDEYNHDHEDGFYGSYCISTDDDRRRFYLDRN